MVDGFDDAQDFAARLQRDAQDGGGQQAGLTVDCRVIERVGVHIVYDQRSAVSRNPACDPLFEANCDVADAHLAAAAGFEHELLPAFVQQEKDAGLHAEQALRVVHGVLERGLKIEGRGDLPPDLAQHLELAGASFCCLQVDCILEAHRSNVDYSLCQLHLLIRDAPARFVVEQADDAESLVPGGKREDGRSGDAFSFEKGDVFGRTLRRHDT